MRLRSIIELTEIGGQSRCPHTRHANCAAWAVSTQSPSLPNLRVGLQRILTTSWRKNPNAISSNFGS
jgi:hypothetical protein